MVGFIYLSLKVLALCHLDISNMFVFLTASFSHAIHLQRRLCGHYTQQYTNIVKLTQKFSFFSPSHSMKEKDIFRLLWSTQNGLFDSVSLVHA